ncbi:MAG: SoxR reducing system RseC family protein [Gammaproteobacteria bacterium]|nr:SoxR reducing system RseC family protein [Gammaproteobacteria bacterium]
MIEEQARVVAIEGNYALVETQRKSTCESCSVNKGCGTASLSKAFGRKAVQFRAVNHTNASVNEQVVIGIDEGWLLKGSFAAYVVPLVLMLLCAGIGEMIGARLWGGESEGVTIFAAMLGLAAGFIWLRRYTGNLRQREACQPEILRNVPGETRIEFKSNPALNRQK